jgi:hypothetical protein
MQGKKRKRKRKKSHRPLGEAAGNVKTKGGGPEGVRRLTASRMTYVAYDMHSRHVRRQSQDDMFAHAHALMQSQATTTHRGQEHAGRKRAQGRCKCRTSWEGFS